MLRSALASSSALLFTSPVVGMNKKSHSQKKIMRLEDEAANVNWRKLYGDLQQPDRYSQLTTRVADNIKNRASNRYYNVLAYDHSRVVVQTDEDTQAYINANFVRVPKANRKYILTQGPLKDTSDLFWLMCYQQKCPAILMLCKCREIDMDKCWEYWPREVGDSHHHPSVNLTVKLVKEVRESDQHYIVRSLVVTDTRSKVARQVKQFQYITWPDFNVPRCPDAFLDFLQAVRETGCLEHTASGPTVVHCSAGIGRSGTFCLVDSCLVMAATGETMTLDLVKETLLDMRQYRTGLVQTEDQLRFSVTAILAGYRRFILEQEEEDSNGEVEEAVVEAGKIVVNGKRIPDRRSESPTLTKKRKSSDS